VMYQLPFLDDGCEHSPIRWLQDVKSHGVPTRAGVYVLLARPGVQFMYPRRSSSVFYIGQASDLRRRLYAHARFVREAKRGRRLALYWPMYEYGASFGCRYVVSPAGRRKCKLFERDLLAMFAEHYHSWPVANAAGGWNSLRTVKQLVQRRDS
jgi:hypothetical protein